MLGAPSPKILSPQPSNGVTFRSNLQLNTFNKHGQDFTEVIYTARLDANDSVYIYIYISTGDRGRLGERPAGLCVVFLLDEGKLDTKSISGFYG